MSDHCKAWTLVLKQVQNCSFNALTGTPVYTQSPTSTCTMDVQATKFSKLHFTGQGYASTTSFIANNVPKPVTGEKYMMFAQWRLCPSSTNSACDSLDKASITMNMCWAQSSMPLNSAGDFEGLNSDAQTAATNPADKALQFNGESTPNQQDQLCYFNGAGNNNVKNLPGSCMGQTYGNILQTKGIVGPIGLYGYSVQWYSNTISHPSKP